MPMLSCQIPQSLMTKLVEAASAPGQSISHLVVNSLSQTLGVPIHTLFQVSTSRALVEGLYERAVSSRLLLNHGDFGLGTFEDLDGEMVVLDGEIYQAKGDGQVTKVNDDVGTPFAVVTKFTPDQTQTVASAASFDDLTKTCNQYRDSGNLFYAFRIDGRFGHIRTRAMRKTAVGVPLVKAAASQPEFDFHEIDGTLVGIWSPQFAGAFTVAGYHFHFLSADRSKGGHLLECSGSDLKLSVERLSDFHLSLPESADFLRADLSRDSSGDLDKAEKPQ